MKQLFNSLICAVCLIVSSCEGPPGPPGPPGRDGGLLVSQAFEIQLNFTANNNYQFTEPYGFEVFPTDVTLVYILWETTAGQEVWRLLPQQVEFNDGLLIYNYDFTQSDVRFFLDGSTNFNNLDVSWTRNQVFRVVVVPADNVGKHNFTDLDVVMEAYNIKSFEKQ